MPPSWMINLTEGWGEPKKDSEGEDDGFKKEVGGGGGGLRRGKIRLPANIARLQNPFTGWTGALIGAVSILIATCQSETCPFAAVHGKRMADMRIFDCALEEALSSLSGLEISLELRPEQKQAIYMLLSRRDLLAVLPTGFGKNLIFQLLVQVKEILSGKTVIVFCPLKSIVLDQMTGIFHGFNCCVAFESQFTRRRKWQISTHL